jgi:divalent metal cation (Fe/Co/Zn/Cd) transporter
MRSAILYGLVRLGIFAIVFAALLLIRTDFWILWAVVAAVISLCVGYIFFGRLREQSAKEFADRRAARAGLDSDEAAEDTD